MWGIFFYIFYIVRFLVINLMFYVIYFYVTLLLYYMLILLTFSGASRCIIYLFLILIYTMVKLNVLLFITY